MYNPLLYFVYRQKSESKSPLPYEEFRGISAEDAVQLRDYLCDNIDLIDRFIEANHDDYSAEKLEIISGWKTFIKGRFIMLRHLKKYSIFIDESDPPKAYGIVALTDEFEDMFGPRVPIVLSTLLLPFKGRIIYDGVLELVNIYFGAGVRSGFEEAYREAKARFGIITTLPFSQEEKLFGDMDRLKLYLKTESSRELYEEEIIELINKDPAILELYHQEMGKIHARTYRKRLRDIGFSNVWFALLEGIIIGSAQTRKEVEQSIAQFIPAGKKKYVYYFQIKGPKRV